MTQINIKQDIERFIHDVLTDADTKNNPELIAAVTALLDQSIGSGSLQYLYSPTVIDKSPINSKLETFTENLAKEQRRKYIQSMKRRLIQKSKY